MIRDPFHAGKRPLSQQSQVVKAKLAMQRLVMSVWARHSRSRVAGPGGEGASFVHLLFVWLA